MQPESPESFGDQKGRAIDRHVGAQLLALRISRDLSIKALAQTLGVTAARFAGWEDGSYRIPARYLMAVAQVFDCPLTVFFQDFVADDACGCDGSDGIGWPLNRWTDDNQ